MKIILRHIGIPDPKEHEISIPPEGFGYSLADKKILDICERDGKLIMRYRLPYGERQK